MTIDPGEWQAGAYELPRAHGLTDEEKNDIKSSLWSIGITDDIFAMDRYQRLAFLSTSKRLAISVYAAIKHATMSRLTLTQSFEQWSRMNGLPW